MQFKQGTANAVPGFLLRSCRKPWKHSFRVVMNRLNPPLKRLDDEVFQMVGHDLHCVWDAREKLSQPACSKNPP